MPTLRRRASALLVPLGLVAAGACGGGGGAPIASGTKPVTPISTIAITAATPEDRTPVDPPEGLAVQLHVAAPKTIVHALKGYFPSFASQLDARVLAAQVIGAPVLAQLLDIDMPVDAAVLLQPGKGTDGLHLAYAFGVEEGVDPIARLKGAFKLEPRAGGVMRLVPAHAAKWDDPDLGNFRGECWITPALGPAKHRLVCSPEGIASGDVALLAPWLSRGVTRREAEATTAKLEVDVVALRKVFEEDLRQAHDELASESGRWMKIDRAETDKVLARLTKALVDEAFDLVGDLDAVTIETTLSPSGAQASVRSTFGRSVSWIARAALANADGIGKAPKALGALPSEGAWYAAFANASPASDALVQPIQNALLQLAEATAIDDGWPSKDKDAALELVRLLFPRAADAVAVAGEAKPEATTGESNVAAMTDTSSTAARLGNRRSWSLGIVQRDAKPSIDLAKAVAALVTKPSFAATIKKLMRDRGSFKIGVKPLTDKQLPKGAFAQTYDCTLSMLEYAPYVVAEAPVASSGTPKPKPKAKPAPKEPKEKEKVVAHFRIDDVIAFDAGRTFVAWSQNEGPAPLIARLNDAMKGTSKDPWSARDGFSAFADTSAASGALIAIDGLARFIASNPARATSWLADLPSGGRGTFSLMTTSAKAGAGGTSTTSSFLSRDALMGTLELFRLADHYL